MTKDLRKAEFRTSDGIVLERVYGPTADDSADFRDRIGLPGEFPFTRGADPEMYRRAFWIMGMYSGAGNAEETNKRFRYLLSQGQTGFSIALDLPTQMGYDPDDPKARGEVGKIGVSLASLEDFELLFDGIPLEDIRQIRTTANAISPLFAAMVIAMARRKGIDPGNIKLFLQNDVLKEYVARGTYIYPPGPSLKHSVDVIEYCASNGLENWTPMSVAGYHIRDSGATPAQELAFCLANAMAYFREAKSRGIEADRFAQNIWMFLAGDINLLEEVAKFRCARRIWAKLMRDRFGARIPETQALKIFCYTLGGRLTAQQPLNNIARVAIMTLGAVLGGVQTLATSSYDEAYSTPTEESAAIALRIQQIVAHESGVADIVDALGGSWAVEALTDQLEDRVMAMLSDVEERGGAVACIESGYFQREISGAAYRHQCEVDSAERVVVGVNAFEAPEKTKIHLYRPDPEIEQRQVARIRALRKRRNQGAVESALAALEAVARSGGNTIDSTVACVEAYATTGEICATLRRVWGRYEDRIVF
ncbi:MAG: methylmalonyl-CoA mutase [Burkholderiaceae bacterium]|nr:methylmalonyl-CoA mutase [Burkholderiaceae bacterium]